MPGLGEYRSAAKVGTDSEAAFQIHVNEGVLIFAGLLPDQFLNTWIDRQPFPHTDVCATGVTDRNDPNRHPKGS